MPLLFIIVGLILVVTAIRGTTEDFGSRLAVDFSGGYLKWLAAIVLIGLIGYIPGFKTPSHYLLGLVAVVLFLMKGTGFLESFVQQVENPQPIAGTTAGGSSTGGSSSGGDSLFGNLGNAIGVGSAIGGLF